MTLFEECIESIGKGNITILTKDETCQLSKAIFERFEFNSSNSVDWSNYPNALEGDINEVLRDRGSNGDTLIVMWDDYDIPIIKLSLGDLLGKEDDLEAVSFDTFIVNENMNWILELYDGGRVKITQ